MYVVKVVQAHANVHARPHSYGVVHSTTQGSSRSTRHMLHTQSSSSNTEQQIIYMPPLQEQQQALVRVNSSGHPLALPLQHSAAPLAAIRPASSSSSSSTISPKLRKAAGVLAKLAAPWQRTTALTAIKPRGTGRAISAGKLEQAGEMIICLPDGTEMLLESSSSGTSSSSSAACKLPAAAFPAAVMLRRPTAAAVARVNNQQLLGRASRNRMPAHISAATAVSSQQWPTAADAAAAAKPAASGRSWTQQSSGTGAVQGAWSAASSSRVTATPAFSIPGYYYTPSSSSSNAFGGPGSDWGGPTGGSSSSGSNSKPLAGNPTGSRAAAADAAAGGGRGASSSFGALSAVPLRLAKLGVGLMGLAAAAALASIYWEGSQRSERVAAAQANAFRSTDGAAMRGAAGALDKMGEAAAAATAGGADTPGFHEWMVRRLQATLQQFDAEKKLLQTELQMLQALSSSKGKAAGDTSTAAAAGLDAAVPAAAASGSSSTWSKIRRWFGFTGSSSSSSDSTATLQHTAAAGGEEAGELTPAGIAARMADIKEQLESLDVLKAALSAEAAEQQRQQQRAEAA